MANHRVVPHAQPVTRSMFASAVDELIMWTGYGGHEYLTEVAMILIIVNRKE